MHPRRCISSELESLPPSLVPEMNSSLNGSPNGSPQGSPNGLKTPRARLLERIFSHAVHAPDSLAVVDEGSDAKGGERRLSYAQLAAAAAGCAALLRRFEAPGERLIAVGLPRGAEWVTAQLGACVAGAAFLPLDPAWPVERLLWMLTDSGASDLITSPELAPALAGGWRTHVPNDWAAEEFGLAFSGRGADGRRGGAEGCELAYVIYTSGSSGEPKGVEITTANLEGLTRWHTGAWAVEASDRAAQIAAPGFDAAIWETWPYLAAGACLYFPAEPERREPRLLRDWLVARGITLAFAPTLLAERLLELDWPAETALRALLTGADALRRFPPAGLPFDLINNYGPTECTVLATSGVVPPRAEGEGREAAQPPTLGRPLPGVFVEIADEGGAPVAEGGMGEILIGGWGVGRGYRGRPELTAASFRPDPARPGARRYRTGDLGRRLPNGEIAFLGRADEQVKIRGHRVEPEEIALALAAHPAVAAAVVIARADEVAQVAANAAANAAASTRLVAYWTPTPGGGADEADLRAHLRRRLPPYMLPARFVRLAQWPVGANGKLDRAALPPPAPVSAPPVAIESRSPVEARLEAILRELMGLERIGPAENFFHLGGHSLLGAQVVARVHEDLGVELSLRSIFEHPTLAALAAEIERRILAACDAAEAEAAAAQATGAEAVQVAAAPPPPAPAPLAARQSRAESGRAPAPFWAPGGAPLEAS